MNHPPQDDKHVSRLNEVFDFSVRPGVACVKPEIAKRLIESYKKGQAQQIADMATPPESDWTEKDRANQRRVAADVEKAVERMHLKMGLAVAVVGILLAVAIHFLGKP